MKRTKHKTSKQTLPKSYLNLLITMHDSELGLFGTVWLMKRMTDEQVAALPINMEAVTFGRAGITRDQCSARGNCVAGNTGA
jgi:hypothetical protein